MKTEIADQIPERGGGVRGALIGTATLIPLVATFVTEAMYIVVGGPTIAPLFYRLVLPIAGGAISTFSWSELALGCLAGYMNRQMLRVEVLLFSFVSVFNYQILRQTLEAPIACKASPTSVVTNLTLQKYYYCS